jgi:hypothetical protein
MEEDLCLYSIEFCHFIQLMTTSWYGHFNLMAALVRWRFISPSVIKENPKNQTNKTKKKKKKKKKPKKKQGLLKF